MLATTEVVKILAAYDTNASASLLRFDGLRMAAEPIASSNPDCGCEHA